MIQSKNKLRQTILQQLKSLDLNQKANWDETIYQKFIDSQYCQKYQTFALYSALPYEVTTNKIIKYLLQHNKIVLLPRVSGKQLNFYQIKSLKQLINNHWGIREPDITAVHFNHELIEVVVVPIIGFTDSYDRIGHGKGYYDRYLGQKQTQKLITVGLAYQLQRIKTFAFQPDK